MRREGGWGGGGERREGQGGRKGRGVRRRQMRRQMRRGLNARTQSYRHNSPQSNRTKNTHSEDMKTRKERCRVLGV